MCQRRSKVSLTLCKVNFILEPQRPVALRGFILGTHQLAALKCRYCITAEKVRYMYLRAVNDCVYYAFFVLPSSRGVAWSGIVLHLRLTLCIC